MRFERWLYTLPLRLRSLFRRSVVEQELDEELSYHVERLIEFYRARGLSAAAARTAALRDMGGIDRRKEEVRDTRRVSVIENLVRDVDHGVRVLRRSPGFTLVAVLTVALGVGANTAIFGVLDAVLFKTLPVRDPEQLVFLSGVGAGGERYGGPPYPWFEEIRERSRSFDGMAVFAVDHVPVSIDGRPEQVLGQVASGSYFELLGVRAAIGRTLTPDDERLTPPVAVLGYRYWQRRFGGRRDVLGSTIEYQGQSVTIVGVTAPGFDGLQTGQPIDITFPVTTVGYGLLDNRDTWWSDAVARVQRGVPIERAQREVAAIFASLESEATTPSTDRPARTMQLEPAGRGLGHLRRQLSALLFVLLGAVGAVLLIGCLNIANLIAVRTSARRHELAVRGAIGAGTGRLVRQSLTETVVLFFIGAVIGLGVAYGVQRLFSGYLAIGRNPIVLPLSLDLRVLGFTAVLTLLAAVLTGLAPAVRAGRASRFRDLRITGSRAARDSPIGATLVMVQVAISIVILVGGSLFIRTLVNLRSIDPGFRSEGVLTLSVLPPESAYPPERRGYVWREVLRRVNDVPGVESASLSVLTPLSGRDRARRLWIPGFQPRSASDRRAHYNYVSPDFFETMGMRVALGRGFTPADDEGAPRVAVMNAAAARFYFGTRSPIGSTIAFDEAAGPDASYAIVGVVADARHLSLREEAPRFVYLPLAQGLDSPSRLTLAVRASSPLASMVDLVRHEVHAAGEDILVSDIETLEQQLDRALLRERLLSLLSGAFAVLGLLLAALGLYGLTAYAVMSRAPEIGIRIALGASPAAVQWLMLRRSLTTVATGVVMGVPLSLLAAATIARFLYEVSPTDPLVVVGCIILLLTVAALASYVPARRASRIDPARTLTVQ